MAKVLLKKFIKKSDYQLKETILDDQKETLVLDFDVNLVCGDRLVRYLVGLGAGKGSINSMLILRDSQSKQLQFQSLADSELSIDFLGGDMEKVIKDNLISITTEYPSSPIK